MQKIAIYGAGGFGGETRLLINQINELSLQWKFVGFFDDNKSVGNNGVLGNLEALNGFKEPLNVVVAIADSAIRKKIVEGITNNLVSFPVLIHPNTILEPNEVTVGEGSIITANNVFTSNIELGRHTIINLSCTIGHDVILGDYGSIMPGVHLSGHVKAGEQVLIGTGARILQNINIGDQSRVGAGAVVTRDVQPGTTVVGVPAKIIKHA